MNFSSIFFVHVSGLNTVAMDEFVHEQDVLTHLLSVAVDATESAFKPSPPSAFSLFFFNPFQSLYFSGGGVRRFLSLSIF